MYVEMKNIVKKYGDFLASDHVSLGVEKGKLVALLGPSGSGKTTLLRMIAGLENPNEGDIYIDGKRVNDVPAAKRGIGFVFQNYALFRYMTVYDNVAFGLVLQKMPKKQIKERVTELLAMTGLSGMEKRYPNQLSGGQRQRVAFARALAPNPRVLLLDEPFAAIDAKVRTELRSWLKEMVVKLGITSIFVTHDQEEAMSISDIIVVMKDGVVQQIGKPQDVYDSPVNLFVAKFLGTPPINVFEGQIRGGSLYIGENAVLLTPGISDQPVSVGIRPEGFIPDEKGSLCCQLGGMEVMGRDISVVSTHASSVNPVIRSIISSDTQIRLDAKTIRFSIKPNKIFLFRHDTGERINL